jgi:chromosome segregation ATPase
MDSNDFKAELERTERDLALARKEAEQHAASVEELTRSLNEANAENSDLRERIGQLEERHVRAHGNWRDELDKLRDSFDTGNDFVLNIPGVLTLRASGEAARVVLEQLTRPVSK